MVGDQKIDLISGAYSKLRISGLTVQPSPRDTELALNTLENMMAEYTARNICVNYKFENEPDTGSPSGVERKYWDAIMCVLAVRLIPDFGKGQQPDPILITQSNGAISFLSSNTAMNRQVQPPNRMPRGSGNRRYRGRGWNNYNVPVAEAPLNCETNKMIIGDIDDFTEDFNNYLNTGEDVTSYELQVSPGLLIVSTSLNTPVVDYRLQAVGDNERNPSNFYQAKITATTTDGRVRTRVINFELSSKKDLTGGDGDIMIGVTFLKSLQTAVADQTVFTTIGEPDEFKVNQVFLDQVLMTTGYSGQGTETITLDAGLYEGQEVYLTT